MRTINAKYAQIDTEKCSITLLEQEPEPTIFTDIVEDATITIKDNCISIVGNKWNCELVFGKCFVDDLESKPRTKYVKYGYKTPLDLIRGIKKPYVKGLYLSEKLIPYKVEMSRWVIVY